MGMYTELHFSVELKPNLPQQVIDTLAHMTGQVPTAPGALPEHPLFRTGRSASMLICDSTYFPAETATDFVLESSRWHLSVRSNFKNFDDEVDHFLDWIGQYVNADEECLGYYRYEEDAHPTLIYAAGIVDVGALLRAAPGIGGIDR